MQQPNVSAASILPKLQSILHQDIDQLDNMLKNREKKSKSYELISTMKDSKVNILSDFPSENFELTNSPSTSQLYSLTGYSDSDNIDFNDETVLLKNFHKIEESQYSFIKYALRAEGIPDGIRSIMEKILYKYAKIVEQLDRSRSTNQVDKIQI